MNSLKDNLEAWVSQGVEISINHTLLQSLEDVTALQLSESTPYMLDYVWDDNGNFVRLNINLMDNFQSTPHMH